MTARTYHTLTDSGRGFSLLELLASVAIIAIVMGALFTFIYQSQKRFQGNQVVSESNQDARAALEVMTQEIGQAGSNPNFTANKFPAGPSINISSEPVASPTAQCVTLTDVNQIFPNDWVAVDTGPNYELAQVITTSKYTSAPSPACAASITTPWIQVVLQQDHCQSGASGCTAPEQPGLSAWPFPIASYKQPYPSGILTGTGTSDDKTLEFFGEINDDGVLNYVVYSLYAPAGAPTVAISGNTYTLYTLYRSITPVTFVAGAVNNPASPMVQNVLYNTALKQGPTGQPIFSTSTITVGVVPNVLTVVGTVVINLSIAVNPQDIETGGVQYYNLATQIRPVNLTASIAVNNADGGKYLPLQPSGLPMTNPVTYYQ